MRLCEAALPSLPADIARPTYDRRAVASGVVHLGVGAFHRAHQAAVFEAALSAGDPRWGIVGASLRSPEVAAALNPQQGLYTLLARDGAGARAQIVGALRRVLVAPQDPAALIAALASPEVHLVTMTITEKGYKPLIDADLREDPDVLHDIAHPDHPRTAFGFLVAALSLRRARGLAPFTVIPCDNLKNNGARTRAGVAALAGARDRGLADWILAEGAFPSTMVDRIVPATTPDDIAELSARLGADDVAMVKTEPFTQWVIEDVFAGPRPDFSAFGVELTRDVAPWEEAKLRLLNGSHSALAYLGALAGHAHVADAMDAQGFAPFVQALMNEAEASLSPPPELDVARYRAQLLARFRNPALRHRTRQIAMDGSQKIPQRLLDTMRAALAADRPFPAHALAVAAWMRWQLGRDETGAAYAVEDPLAERTAGLVAGRSSPREIAARLLTLEPVFGGDLPNTPRFVDAVVAALARLLDLGAARAVVDFTDAETHA
jgi:fructuronate reductase